MSSTDPPAFRESMFYTPPPLSKKTKIVIILIVLLIHLLLLFPFLNTEFIFSPKSPLEQKVKELHKKVHKIKDEEAEEWATLKSRAMQMSAPVILVDDPDSEKKADKEEEEARQEPDTEEPSQTHKTDQDSLDKDAPQPTLIDIPEKDGTHPIILNKEELPIEQKQPMSELLSDKKQSTPQIQPKTAPKPQQKKPPIAQTKRAAAAKAQQPKQKLSLAQLAQGFVDHMKHEGDYTIAMSGNDSAKATESQLKIGRFLQRIIGSIQNAWRVNINRYPLSHAVIVSIHFTIVINKDGSLNKVGIDKSSGDQRIDNYIKLIVQDASSSFPSIPDYMSHSVCSIRCTLDDIRLPDGPPGYTIRQ